MSYMIREGFQRIVYVWNALVGSNQGRNCCSLLPTPCAYTFVCIVYGIPEEFPKNSKSISSCPAPSDDNCNQIKH